MATPFKLILVFIFFAYRGVLAQDSLPPAYELKTDTANLYQIDNYYSQLLEDPENNFTIKQVGSPAFSRRFHANNTKEKGVNYQIKTYWLRFRIRNNLNRKITLHLTTLFNNPIVPAKYWHLFNHEYFFLYFQKSSGNWVEQKNGSLVPWSQRAGTKAIPSIPIQLLPKQELTFYTRLHNSFLGTLRPEYLNINFTTDLSFYKSAYFSNLEGEILKSSSIRLLFIGIFFSTILFSLYNYVLIRENAYLYYLLFLLFYSLVQFPREYWFLVLPEYPELFYWGWLIFNDIAHAFLIQFIRGYLITRQRAPFWDKLLIMSVIFMFTLTLNYFLIYDKLTSINAIFIPVSTAVSIQIVVFTIALTIIHLYRKQYPPAKFLLLTLAPFLFIWSLVDFAGIAYSTINFLLNGRFENPLLQIDFYFYAEFFTTFWMVIFFSTALTRRYMQARRAIAEQALEKERLEKEKEVERSQLIEAQKLELEKQVAARTSELKLSLEHLKATQAQLIQSEKMASLGELTAGIAHEIQNPLNFVNNFSEVSFELVEEIKQETEANHKTELLAIAEDLKQNLEKIHYHGKRADAIVKNMLQHSRRSTGQKEPVNINTLAEEYLRLAYQGIRAKDKDFNANLITDLETNLGKVEVVPQEIGRVLLNLFNNAFYATQQKKIQQNGQYQPEVKVSTGQENGSIKIKVRDNGMGIPEALKSKIFQPFFTTKPTGQGTGLGLSLSYDIITKGHNGGMKVESQEGDYSEFSITIPF